MKIVWNKQDEDCKITFSLSLKFYRLEHFPGGFSTKHGAPQQPEAQPEAHVRGEDPGGARAAGSGHTKIERELGSGLGRCSLLSFPLPSSPTFCSLLQEFQSRSPSRDRGSSRGPFRGFPRAGEPPSVPARGRSQGGGVSSSGLWDQLDGREGKSRGSSGAGQGRPRLRGLSRATAPPCPAGQVPAGARPPSGPWAPGTLPGTGKSFRQRLRYEVQDETPNSPRFCCQATLKQATSLRHIILIFVSPLEGSLKSCACGRGLQCHLCVGLCVLAVKGEGGGRRADPAQCRPPGAFSTSGVPCIPPQPRVRGDRMGSVSLLMPKVVVQHTKSSQVTCWNYKACCSLSQIVFIEL